MALAGSSGSDPRRRIIGGSSYYDTKTQRFGDSLIRARQPYFFKNIGMGLALTGVVSGIFLYTLKAIGTDEFEDVKPAIPPPQSESSQNKS